MFPAHCARPTVLHRTELAPCVSQGEGHLPDGLHCLPVGAGSGDGCGHLVQHRVAVLLVLTRASVVTWPAPRCCCAGVSLGMRDKAPCSAQPLLVAWPEFNKSLPYTWPQRILSLGPCSILSLGTGRGALCPLATCRSELGAWGTDSPCKACPGTAASHAGQGQRSCACAGAHPTRAVSKTPLPRARRWLRCPWVQLAGHQAPG